MVDRQLRSDLLASLKCSKQALSQRAKRMKETYGPMTTDEAVYVIAHLKGLDLSRYLPLATIDRIRSLVPRAAPPDQLIGQPASRKKTAKKATSTPYPLIPLSLSRQAYSLGANVFPPLFQLENSIRLLIDKVLAKSGTDWWEKRVPNDVQANVQRTMTKEKRYPYRGPRAKHPLYYANFDDLKKIILFEMNQADFILVIPDLGWFKTKMDEVYMARNNLAHCVPLSTFDVWRILGFHRDWAQLLDTAGIK